MCKQGKSSGKCFEDERGEIKMVLLIDNYDSFAYNLYQLIEPLKPGCEVFRNDKISLDEIRAKNPEAIILSPGPGRPADAGICESVVKELKGEFPVFGVCLGHQAICEANGATVTYAKELMHGKTSDVFPEEGSLLFKGLSKPFKVARYHSLAVDERTLPEGLRVSARTGDGEVMAVEDIKNKVFGVQFHPESVMTPDGESVLKNFFDCIK